MHAHVFMKRSILLVPVFSLLACDGANSGALTEGENNATAGGNASGGAHSSGGSSQPPGSRASGLPCDVGAILQKNCQTCHAATPAYGAPMPLVSYADLATNHVADRVKARIHDDNKPMPPSPNPRLSASDMAVIDKWVGAGA